MTANANDPAALRAFEAFLDVHGANRSRWPAQQRLQFASLIAESEEARRLLEEAEALDRLIGTIERDDVASPTSASASTAKTALTNRIMAAALADANAATPPSPPLAEPAPSRAPAASTSNVVPLPHRKAPLRPRRLWPVGAMMAASLLAGLMTGVTTMSTLNSGADFASTDAAGEAAYDPAVIALDNDSYGPLGGDLL